MVPLTWEACKYADSSNCGGQSAKWCIGYKESDEYFKRYTNDSKLFIMVFRKGQAENNALKFMLEIFGDNKITVWDQTDNERDFEFVKLSDEYTKDEIIAAFDKAIFSEAAGVSVYSSIKSSLITEISEINEYLTFEDEDLFAACGHCNDAIDYNMVVVTQLCDDDWLTIVPLDFEGFSELEKAVNSLRRFTHEDFAGFVNSCIIPIFVISKLDDKSWLVLYNVIAERYVTLTKTGSGIENFVNSKFGHTDTELDACIKSTVLSPNSPKSLFKDKFDRRAKEQIIIRTITDVLSSYDYIKPELSNSANTTLILKSTRRFTVDMFNEVLRKLFYAGIYLPCRIGNQFDVDDRGRKMNDGTYVYNCRAPIYELRKAPSEFFECDKIEDAYIFNRDDGRPSAIINFDDSFVLKKTNEIQDYIRYNLPSYSLQSSYRCLFDYSSDSCLYEVNFY